VAVGWFHDRAAAGQMLAQELFRYADRPDVLVLALPRGGVPVAYEIAVSTLEHAAQLGWQAGLEFVYVGNVPEHRLQHTYCLGCGRRLIERRGMAVVANWLENGHCPACGRAIDGPTQFAWANGASLIETCSSFRRPSPARSLPSATARRPAG
jgi:hypothetical protein